MKSRFSAGYTLIELLVGITIIGLIFGFGFTSFRDFSRRQSLAGAAKEIEGDLRLVQELGLAGKKPDHTSCNSPNRLSNYGFRVVTSTSYQLEANCTGGISPVVIKTVDLAQDVTISTPSTNPITFKALGQGTNISQGEVATLTLTQLGTGSQMDITISAAGEIK